MKIQLKQILERKNMSLSELSRRSKVPKGTLAQWQSRSKSISLPQAKAVADVLGIGLHDLIFGVPDPNHDLNSDNLKQIFSGDVRVTIHEILRKK